MERKFYPENFERFLKGHADQFKMTPSKKVWHGIYNDLHPGRRWPSTAMSMVFVFTLVIVGHLNTNNGNNTSLHHLSSLTDTDPKTEKTASKRITLSNWKHIPPVNNSIVGNENITGNNASNTTPLLLAIKNDERSSNTQDGLNKEEKTNIISSSVTNKTEILSSNKIENDVTTLSQKTDINIPEQADLNLLNDEEKLVNIEIPTNEEKNTADKKITDKTSTLSNTASSNKPKKVSNVTWTYYLSPSISNRFLSDKNVDDAGLHTSMLGYEGGTAMSFNIYKKLQFTSGLQFNYLGYNIKANNIHPTVATLILQTETAGRSEVYSALSHYGNRTGTEYTKLKNYNLQVSLPIGLQYAFAGNENTKFNAAASFQPTYIIAGRSYLLSEDKKNYITNPDLLRKLNMNTSFTAYVSFSSNSFNWQIGPQVRYQLLSTYTNRFQLKENLINYGIRVGISNLSK